jgi:hypothetical protein
MAKIKSSGARLSRLEPPGNCSQNADKLLISNNYILHAAPSVYLKIRVAPNFDP